MEKRQANSNFSSAQHQAEYRGNQELGPWPIKDNWHFIAPCLPVVIFGLPKRMSELACPKFK